jgi:katanin p60 ATPase-containing subunit A1
MMRKRLPADKSDCLAYEDYAARLDGYSGSDLTLLCKEAAMRPVRRLMEKLEALEEAQQSHPRPGGRAGAVAASVVGTDVVKLDKVTNEDVRAAIAVTKPSARLMGSKYEAWQAEFGSC